MAKTEKRKTVHYVYRWESTGKDVGTVTAYIQFEHHRSTEIYRQDVKLELFEAVGESLINKLRKASFY